MKKVLIITYYWPPSGGSGVQRWLKFVKYLPAFGWKPIVVAPENPEYPVIDHSLQADIPSEAKIIKLPIWEPYGIFKKITGRKKEEKVNTGLLFDEKKCTLPEKISIWIRGNLLIPDPRIFWVKPSALKLIKLIPQLKPDILITTGTPHSVHLIGKKIKDKFPKLPWLADLRDPWSDLDMLDQFYASSWALKKQKKIEYKTLATADIVTTVSPTWKNELQKSIPTKVYCITNGFDEEDFINYQYKSPDNNFILSHVGIINSYRNPLPLWTALEELCNEIPMFKESFQLQIIGITDTGLEKTLKKFPEVKKRTLVTGYISHDKVIEQYQKSSCLLLLLNNTKNSKGHIPGKFFEYLASSRPVLAIAPQNSDVAKILKENQNGYACPFEEKDTIKKAILSIFNKKISSPYTEIINSYSRENITKQLSDLLLKTIKNVK
jgi:glycosyltransferase involved in cell wall biosynthesis